MTLKLGIIGLGRMGKHHARVAQMIPNIKLTAVADQNPTIEKNLLPLTTFICTDYKELLHLVDAVIIATPTPTHYDIANECLSAGINVLLEKPITPTLFEATKLFDKAIQKNKTLHIGHIERFNPAFVQYNTHISHEPFFIESSRTSPFVSRVAHDSVVLDLMIHDIDLAVQLIDSPVYNIDIVGKKIYSKNFDITTAHIEFKNGSHAFFHANRISQTPCRTMAIHTPAHIFQLDFMEQTISTHTLESNTQQPQELLVLKENALLKEITHFIDAITSKTDALNGIKDLTTLQITLDLQKKLTA